MTSIEISNTLRLLSDNLSASSWQVGIAVAQQSPVLSLLQRKRFLGDIPGEPADVCVPHGCNPVPAANPMRHRWQQQLCHVQPSKHLPVRLLQQGLQAVPRPLRAPECGFRAQWAVHQLRDRPRLPGPGAEISTTEDGLPPLHPHHLHQQRDPPGDLLWPALAQTHVPDPEEQQEQDGLPPHDHWPIHEDLSDAQQQHRPHVLRLC